MQENRPSYRTSSGKYYKPIDMNSEIKKVEDLEVGKYYNLGGSKFIKVEYELDVEKIGISINIRDWIVSVELDDIFDDVADYDGEDFFYSEITQEEFEQKLQEAQEEFIKMIGQIKTQYI
nr:MAG TPA: hypothetical protein [Caudoviricetes sp.]